MTPQDGSYEYDVCLSFADEQRQYVQQIAEGLRARGVKVFYDGYERATLWGKDLNEHLDRIYRRSARYCIIFASKEYADKVWTNHERRSAQARALREKSEYILPARFDDTEIPGLRDTVAYVDLRTTSAAELLDLIAEKIASPAHPGSREPAAGTAGVPARVASSGDPLWPGGSSMAEPAVVATLKPRTSAGPVEAFARGQRVVALLPLEGGGRLSFEVDRPGAAVLAARLAEAASKMTAS